MMRMVYHHPGEIVENGTSGSQVRPYRMLQAFRQIGCQVDVVAGNLGKRKLAANKVLDKIKNGTKYDFLYSENRTIPFAMVESHRLPLHPFMDHLFLHKCHRSGIPLGLFYRDVYWRDKAYREMASWWMRWITVPLYWYDWLWHGLYIDHMFIPSMTMKQALPRLYKSLPTTALPPGVTEKARASRETPLRPRSRLRLLYVGGVMPPTYNLAPLLLSVQNLDVDLTICCRPAEWQKSKSVYQSLLQGNCQIVHKSGDELGALYKHSDAAAIVLEATDYRAFAVPVKLFEALSYGVPIIASAGTEAARIVKEEGFGWTVDGAGDIRQLLQVLQGDPYKLLAVRDRMTEKIPLNTWDARARRVIDIMTRGSSAESL